MQIDATVQLQRCDNGIWIYYGPYVGVNLTNYAESKGGIIGKQILDWAEKQLAQVPPDDRGATEGSGRGPDGPG